MQRGWLHHSFKANKVCLELVMDFKTCWMKRNCDLNTNISCFDQYKRCGNYNDLIILSAEQYPKDNISISNFKYLHCLCRKEIIPT